MLNKPIHIYIYIYIYDYWDSSTTRIFVLICQTVVMAYVYGKTDQTNNMKKDIFLWALMMIITRLYSISHTHTHTNTKTLKFYNHHWRASGFPVSKFTYKPQKYMVKGDTSVPWYTHTHIWAEGVTCDEIFIFWSESVQGHSTEPKACSEVIWASQECWSSRWVNNKPHWAIVSCNQPSKMKTVFRTHTKHACNTAVLHLKHTTFLTECYHKQGHLQQTTNPSATSALHTVRLQQTLCSI